MKESEKWEPKFYLVKMKAIGWDVVHAFRYSVETFPRKLHFLTPKWIVNFVVFSSVKRFAWLLRMENRLYISQEEEEKIAHNKKKMKKNTFRNHVSQVL